jgi:hypothetical protein
MMLVLLNDFEIGSTCLAAAGIDFDRELDVVTLCKVTQASRTDGRDVDKYVVRAIVRLDKAIVFAIAAKPFRECPGRC